MKVQQWWRALAKLKNGEALLCLGESSIEVKTLYQVPWFEIFLPEVRKATTGIFLQQWEGPSTNGRWLTQGHLPLPTRSRVRVA